MTLLIPPLVWLGWYFLPQQSPLPVLLEHWRIALTMAFGSFIGGATSEAGGAVAFPVFTKILAIPPKHAKLFSLATQSIGMGSAFLTILLLRIRVEWRAIFWVVPGSIPMLYVGLNLAGALPASAVRILFTVVQCSFALALYLHNRNPAQSRHDCLPRCEIRERSILLVFGMAGGLISGLLGSGLEIIVFSVLVLLFRLCEKTATPTVIVMMVLTTWAGFAMIVSRGEFVAPVTEYWLAAIPIVVVGGPLGVYACSHMPRIIIVRVLIGLILAELISSLLLIPLDRATAVGALVLFLAFSGIYYRMSLSQRYR
ncbi:sulfite exporter TauE/SafE family protein [Candidatus Methylospira mobilis]|uniref:Probable membrane transporter protein n=2 Tax=Candidatus Methylospira mobilis TaxID=1808979 RepID=A0A5Q0BJA4_9GAMM|nr:sulfite exporter TauE/SafE family protein [Candidatus Methylospira mobilis]